LKNVSDFQHSDVTQLAGLDYQGGSAGGGGYGGDFGAGGFGASQGSGGRNSTGGKSRRNYDEQTLLPVTASMILAASDNGEGSGTLVLPDGRKLNQVKLIGAVRSWNEFSTNVVYEIEDGTGLVEVKEWLDDSDCTAILEMRQETRKEHIYVSVVGSVKEYDGRKTVIADSMRAISSGNQLTHHMLEVVYAGEMHNRKDSIIPGGLPMFGSPQFKGMSTSMMSRASSESTREMVLSFIRDESHRSESGASIIDCVNRMSGMYSESEVRQVVGVLCAEGHVYSTIDDDHFKFAM
jgi:replication factor A2